MSNAQCVNTRYFIFIIHICSLFKFMSTCDLYCCYTLMIKKKIQHFYVNPAKTQANDLYTLTPAKGRLNVPTALCHMLLPSAQR